MNPALIKKNYKPKTEPKNKYLKLKKKNKTQELILKTKFIQNKHVAIVTFEKSSLNLETLPIYKLQSIILFNI